MVLLLLKQICLTEWKLLLFVYHCIAVLSSSSKDYRQEKRNVWVYRGKVEMISLHTVSGEKRMLLNMDLPKENKICLLWWRRSQQQHKKKQEWAPKQQWWLPCSFMILLSPPHRWCISSDSASFLLYRILLPVLLWLFLLYSSYPVQQILEWENRQFTMRLSSSPGAFRLLIQNLQNKNLLRKPPIAAKGEKGRNVQFQP